MPFDSAFDDDKATAFEERFVDGLNAGAMCLMVSVGHRTGLFDAMAGQSPMTSAALAERAGLNERYVREWLGAMSAGRVVEIDPGTGTYLLPPEHATCLVRAAAPNNLAALAQYIPLLGAVEDDIVDCFKNGGGVPYDRFTRFHEVMSEDSGQSVLPALQEHILPLVPGLEARLDQGIRVLDAGCGRGKALNLMAGWYPNSQFVGYDLSQDACAFATEEARQAGHTNIEFVARDLATFDQDADGGQFDFVTTFDAVHDQPDPGALLRGIRTSLAPDGVYLAQDINGSSHVHENVDHPIGPLLYTISCMHCMTVSLAQDGEGLGAMWGRQKANEMLGAAGFGAVEVHELGHDIQNCYYVCRP
jgi:SAM-dependent methyltransferase